MDNTWDEAYGHRAGTHSPTAYRGMVRSRPACEVRGLKSSISPRNIRVDFDQPLKPKTGYLWSANPSFDAKNRKTRMPLIN
jgi:hypothetical protein